MGELIWKDFPKGILGSNFYAQRPSTIIDEATRKENEERAKKQIEEAVKKSRENAQAQKPRTFFEMNQGYIVIGLVLVAGYFAYKKFKK